MRRVISILFLVFITQIGLGQSIKDLSAVEKKNLYQGIIYSERSMCLKANQLLNSFISNYKGKNKAYWHDKARSYLLECNESVQNPVLSYQYRPRIDSPINHIDHADHEHEESLAVDVVIFRDVHRHTFDNMLSLNPEAFYPLIDVKSNTTAENHTHTDHEHEEYLAVDVKLFKDLHRYTFDAITSMTPEAKYPLLDSDNKQITDSPEDKDRNAPDAPSIYVSQVADKEKPEIRIYTSDQDAYVKANREIKIYTDTPDRNAKMAQAEIKIFSSDKKISAGNKSLTIWPEEVKPARVFTPQEISTLKEEIQRTAKNTQSNKLIDQRNVRKQTIATKSYKEKTKITSKNVRNHYKVMFTVSNRPDRSFLPLSSIGPVFSSRANEGIYVYYVGHYDTYEKAERSLKKVRDAGYEMARIIEFDEGKLKKEYITKEDDTIEQMVAIVPTAQEHASSADPEQEATPKQIEEVINSTVVSYHILFRVLDNPYETFDELKGIGTLYRETYDKEGNSRYLIGNTDDIKVARQLLVEVKNAGYATSFIAEYKNGQLNKVIE